VRPLGQRVRLSSHTHRLSALSLTARHARAALMQVSQPPEDIEMKVKNSPPSFVPFAPFVSLARSITPLRLADQRREKHVAVPVEEFEPYKSSTTGVQGAGDSRRAFQYVMATGLGITTVAAAKVIVTDFLDTMSTSVRCRPRRHGATPFFLAPPAVELTTSIASDIVQSAPLATLPFCGV
jgi:hypothetical protein